MSNFIELETPVCVEPNIWMVYATSDDEPKCLNVNGEIISVWSNFNHFKSEAAAHKAAYKYYTNIYQYYPYITEWLSCNSTPYIVTATQQTNNSQVMEFV